jgi:elongation factor Ts
MAVITAALVGQLRQETGAPLLKCKDALVKADGDIEEARTILRKAGAAAAEKVAGKLASEGIVEAYTDEAGAVGVLLELNSQTDFVARNEDFRSLAHELAKQVADAPSVDTYPTVEALLAARSTTAGAEAKTVGERIMDSIGRIGEKIAVARFVRYDAAPETGAIATYIHKTDYKTGVLVQVAAEGTPKSLDALTELAREIALHAAALSPKYIHRDEVPAEILDKEREIAQSKADADPNFAKKPDNIKAMVIEGAVRKWLEQFVLLDQGFVRDPSGKQRVAAVVEAAGKAVGTPVHVVKFARYKVGETAEAPKTDA